MRELELENSMLDLNQQRQLDNIMFQNQFRELNFDQDRLREELFRQLQGPFHCEPGSGADPVYRTTTPPASPFTCVRHHRRTRVQRTGQSQNIDRRSFKLVLPSRLWITGLMPLVNRTTSQPLTAAPTSWRSKLHLKCGRTAPLHSPAWRASKTGCEPLPVSFELVAVEHRPNRFQTGFSLPCIYVKFCSTFLLSFAVNFG